MKTDSHSRQAILSSLALLLAGAPPLQAQDDTARPWEVGALLNLDAGGIPPGDLSRDRAPLELKDAELSLGLRLRPELDAHAVLVHEGGAAAVEQAFAAWTTPAARIVFGKAVLPLGLYPGRLVHDPALQQDVETIAPSAGATAALGPATVHLCGANLEYVTDSVEVSFPAAVAAADLSWSEEGLVRLSTRVAHRARTVDLAARIPLGPVLVDLEGAVSDGAWTGSDQAALMGLAWKPTDTVLLAARLDARRAKGADAWSRSAAAGATVRFAEYAHVAAEWLQDLDGDGVLTLRLGMEI